MVVNIARSTTPIEHITYCLSSPPVFEPLQALTSTAWEDIAVTAIALGLAPLLHWRLEQAGFRPPPAVMAKLGVTRQAHARRNEAIAGQLAELLAAFARRGIDVLVLKGALLAPTVYPEASLRPMNDIDLLFRPESLAGVGPVLEKLGYTGRHKAAGQGPGVTKHLSTYRRPGPEGATPNPYLSPNSDRTVEPHGSLEEAWFGLQVDVTPGVWDRARTLSLHEKPAARLSTPDMILHLTVHAAFHLIMGRAVFLQLYDLGRVIEVWGHEVDWQEIRLRAGATRAEPFVYGALQWARSIFKAPIPDSFLETLRNRRPPALAAYIQALDAPAIFAHTQRPPLTTFSQRLRQGIRDRRETARWAASIPAKWKVWQTALAFHKTDTVALLRKRRPKRAPL